MDIREFLFRYRIPLLASAGVIIASLVIVSILDSQKPVESARDPNFDYSLEPSNWIARENETVKVDVPGATGNRGEHVFNQERYLDTDGEIFAVFLYGTYMGNDFRGSYSDADSFLRMQISPEMDPGDGVIEGYALYKTENNVPVLYLFADEDWKKASSGGINIIWGADIKDPSKIHSAEFSFADNRSGIYYQRITEDIDWLHNQNPITGRLYFGELTRSDVINDNFNTTFVMVI